ncbi:MULTISPECIES: biotin transporter BioY [Leuconostoc]|uniref:Biotin transporter n=2 Tax=Leuconostoc kimchii TaxID=136609 RepID=D5T4X4_LEUKI|nr:MULTISPECIES: biotin transporter BioY [Leuconostoc]ADG41126.1 BioY family protein [Leuconostoc kimchii IMSNU 11154]AEJ30899.1 BioY family protein [Leuconostoc sp. C2]QBR48001.1 biotin transporter BioY [Leuconostoc kimchii]
MKTKKLTFTVAIIAILIVMAYVPVIPIGVVPITIQNIGIMLAGAILGWRHGFLAIIAWLLLAMLGLPVLTGGSGGLPHFFGATAGYLWAYPFAALLIGLGMSMLDKFNATNFVTILLTILLFGVIFIDVSGAVGLNIVTHMPLSKALFMQLAFIPGDAIKAVLATIITLTLRRRFSMLRHV